ncbi:uncharacterized protein LOC131254277 [Magnolia sinica]|uniref:uncharacterized protein LOC131254277 n=1 Tax=Magnolia sinica TaxID=86752 RepID=UPI00265B6A3B|nr:uncharacterized protein LOC131254277 [Magnolia sinica]
MATLAEPFIARQKSERESLLGPKLIQARTQVIDIVQKQLRTTQSRQKSYVDNRCCDLEFAVGDHVFLKISLVKGLMRFGQKGKLAPLFIRMFKTLDRVGAIAYCLAVPIALANIHNVFHISMLKKYMPDESHIVNWEWVELTQDASYIKEPICILDRKEQVLQTKTIPLVKVLWLY